MNLPRGMHSCPTRADGEHVLFAHAVTGTLCQERQRGHYHKCWSCAHRNGIWSHNGARNGLPRAKLPRKLTPPRSASGVGAVPDARP